MLVAQRAINRGSEAEAGDDFFCKSCIFIHFDSLAKKGLKIWVDKCLHRVERGCGMDSMV